MANAVTRTGEGSAFASARRWRFHRSGFQSSSPGAAQVFSTGSSVVDRDNPRQTGALAARRRGNRKASRQLEPSGSAHLVDRPSHRLFGGGQRRHHGFADSDDALNAGDDALHAIYYRIEAWCCSTVTSALSAACASFLIRSGPVRTGLPPLSTVTAI